MGAKDVKSNEYLADNSRFADLFNYKIYDGKQVILPEDLQERDSSELLSLPSEGKKSRYTQKWRDLLKAAVIKSTPTACYVLLAVENQTEVHYAMPVKAMLYDALNYSKQVNKTAKLHKKNKDKMESAEFLSGFKKGDKILPVIPLILYWGSNAWDAPTNLHEMFEDINEELLPFIPNYHINLVEPSSIEDFDKFQTELGQTLEFIKHSNDKVHFQKMLENLEGQNLTNETVSTINLFTSADITINTEGKVTNVCLAIQEIKQEYADEQVAKELINSVENLMKNFSISLEKACSGLEHTVEDYYNAKKLLENTSMN